MVIDPNKLNIPEEFQSERLILRAPRAGDGAELNAAIQESFEQLSNWLDWADHMPDVEETEANLAVALERYRARTDFRILLIDKITKAIVGSSGLHSVDWSVPKFEIGYWVRTPCAGQGYITEAVRAITDFAFSVMGARRVWMCIDTRNIRSKAVAERAGFECEGVLRMEALTRDGLLKDTAIYSLVVGDN